MHVDGIDEAWSVTGPPALCVMFARLGAFGAPFDLVVSGINPGANVGRSVYHSGTVGAALTGRNGGISGVAVSQAVAGVRRRGPGLGRDAPRPAVGDARRRSPSAFVGGLVADAAERRRWWSTSTCPTARSTRSSGWRRAAVGLEPPRPLAKAELEPKVGHDGAFKVAMEWGDALELPPDTDGGTSRTATSRSPTSAGSHEIDRPDMEPAERPLSALVADA